MFVVRGFSKNLIDDAIVTMTGINRTETKIGWIYPHMIHMNSGSSRSFWLLQSTLALMQGHDYERECNDPELLDRYNTGQPFAYIFLMNHMASQLPANSCLAINQLQVKVGLRNCLKKPLRNLILADPNKSIQKWFVFPTLWYSPCVKSLAIFVGGGSRQEEVPWQVGLELHSVGNWNRD